MFSQRLAHARVVALAAFVAVAGLPAGARAFPSVVVLHNVTFDDGGTVVGSFSLNVSGFLTSPTLVTTTPGSVLGGTAYSLIGPFFKDLTHVDFTVPSPPASAFYKEGLSLVFALPLGSAQIDPIVSGCEQTNFSCSGPAFRSITGGFGEIPEPATLILLGGGTFALAAARRRSEIRRRRAE